MSWNDQEPPATNVLITGMLERGGHFEIDKLQDGTYRATFGNLFGSLEFMRDLNLEAVLRAVEKARHKRGRR